MISDWKPCLSIVLICLTAAAKADSPTLPDTAAGRIAKAYVTALNSGDEKQWRQFESEYRATSALKSRSMDERIVQYRELFEKWEVLETGEVLDSNDRELSVLIHARRADEWLRFTFELESQAPQKLEAIRIEGPMAPSAVGAARAPLTDSSRSRILKRIAEQLEKNYVYPEVGSRMARLLRTRSEENYYGDVASVLALADRLTNDLRDICHDKHLRIRPRERRPSNSRAPARARAENDNFGFERIEIMPGNVGYLKFNGFSGHPNAQPVAAAAMAFLANTSALIFDVRENGGGSSDMIAFLCGYLFDKPVHVNTFYRRPDDSYSETWSRDDVPGPTYGQEKPVYVLTSHYTFSAAEEFSYDLKHLKRATLVGEVTGGGAHPVQSYTINKHLRMSVPFARAINPVTQTNWEGVGVIPHVKTDASKALDKAHQLALQRIEELANPMTAAGSVATDTQP